MQNLTGTLRYFRWSPFFAFLHRGTTISWFPCFQFNGDIAACMRRSSCAYARVFRCTLGFKPACSSPHAFPHNRQDLPVAQYPDRNQGSRQFTDALSLFQISQLEHFTNAVGFYKKCIILFKCLVLPVSHML